MLRETLREISAALRGSEGRRCMHACTVSLALLAASASSHASSAARASATASDSCPPLRYACERRYSACSGVRAWGAARVSRRLGWGADACVARE